MPFRIESKGSEMQAQLELKSLGKRFNQNGNYAFEDISLSVSKGELIAIIGSSGCGIPGMDITAYIAKESWLKANPDVAARFKRAIDKATMDLVNAKKEERDGWVAKYTGVKPELVADMTLPNFTTEFNMVSLKANLDLAVKHKVVKNFDVNTMMWKQ